MAFLSDSCTFFNDLITLSQVPTYNSFTFIYCPRGRENIRLFLQSCKGGRIVF